MEKMKNIDFAASKERAELVLEELKKDEAFCERFHPCIGEKKFANGCVDYGLNFTFDKALVAYCSVSKPFLGSNEDLSEYAEVLKREIWAHAESSKEDWMVQLSNGLLQDAKWVSDHLTTLLVGKAGAEKAAIEAGHVYRDAIHPDFIEILAVSFTEPGAAVENSGSVRMTKGYLERLGISAEEAFDVALQNDLRTQAEVPKDAICERFEFLLLKDMVEVLWNGSPESPLREDLCDERIGKFDVIIVTNLRKCYGAKWAFRKSVLSRVQNAFGNQFLILPSSIHECLFVPSAPDAGLNDLVSLVNRESVDDNEVLSDNVYAFDNGYLYRVGDETNRYAV